MAIGSTVVTSIPVVGTTVETLDLVKPGMYNDMVTETSGDVPLTFTVRPAKINNLHRRVGASLTYRPSIRDAVGDNNYGGISVTLNADAKLGTEVGRTEALARIRHFLALLLNTNVLETLIDGGNE